MENNFDPNFMRKWIRSNGSTPMPQDIGLAIIIDEQRKTIKSLKKEIEQIKKKTESIQDEIDHLEPKK